MPAQRPKSPRKCHLQDRILEQVRTDRTLNPHGLGPKAFFNAYFAAHRGAATRELSHLLGCSPGSISYLRRQLGCKMCSRSESGTRRGHASGRRMVDRKDALSPAIRRRNLLMEQARSGDRAAQSRFRSSAFFQSSFSTLNLALRLVTENPLPGGLEVSRREPATNIAHREADVNPHERAARWTSM